MSQGRPWPNVTLHKEAQRSSASQRSAAGWTDVGKELPNRVNSVQSTSPTKVPTLALLGLCSHGWHAGVAEASPLLS